MTPDFIEKLRGLGNDAETLAESYAGERQEPKFLEMAIAFRQAATCIETLNRSRTSLLDANAATIERLAQALQAAHLMVDTLLAMMITQDKTFMPSKWPLWDKMVDLGVTLQRLKSEGFLSKPESERDIDSGC